MYGSLNSSHCLSSTVLQILAIRGFGLIIPFGEIAQNSLNPGLAQPLDPFQHSTSHFGYYR